MRKNTGSDHPLDVIHLSLASGNDALARSRFVHQVVEPDLRVARAVVVK